MLKFGKKSMLTHYRAEEASKADESDQLKAFRSRFLIPKINGNQAVYLCGNSLGLQPAATAASIQQELDDWARLGVEGHVHARRAWLPYHEFFANSLSKITGALASEVVAMNALTVNLNFLMLSFYRPDKNRHRIIYEQKAFPSDVYALQSQVKLHGGDPEKSIRMISAREGRHDIAHEDIIAAIEEEGHSLAMVMIGGVNYYTGQAFDMQSITKAAHAVGAIAGFDLAHAIGNIELKLHEWDVDFAAWCSYKYLNSGPGGVAGIYINEKHSSNPETFRLAGWWGHDKKTRFLMEPDFVPIPTAESWQMSNAPILSMAAHRAALDLFDEAGMPQLILKSKALTGFAETLLKEVLLQPGREGMFTIITPEARGAQLSLLFHRDGRKMFDHLTSKGIIADWREPNVIRIAPVPLYNSFLDVYRFAEAISDDT